MSSTIYSSGGIRRRSFLAPWQKSSMIASMIASLHCSCEKTKLLLSSSFLALTSIFVDASLNQANLAEHLLKHLPETQTMANTPRSAIGDL